MKSYIIGLAGKKNCGKDTVASIINYIFAAGISRAKYSDWIIKRVSYDETYKDRIVHFADSLKDCLSIIYNIPRECFDNRQFKDEMYYSFNTERFVNKYAVNQYGGKYNIITNEVLKHSSLKEELETYDELNNVITLRTLMQYFGTEVCRNNLSDKIWINSSITKMINIANNRRLCIVPDVRFTNEAAAIQRLHDSPYGRVVRIIRNTDNTNEYDYHDSEIISFSTNYSINNDSNLQSLFYKTLEICQKILLQ